MYRCVEKMLLVAAEPLGTPLLGEKMAHTEQLIKQSLLSMLHFSNTTEINIHDRLREDLHLDSMSSLMFLMKLEESIPGFYVDPETLHANDLETISSMIHYVNSQMLERSEHVH